MTRQEHVEHEMSYTTWDESCKEPGLLEEEIRACRRPANHVDDHASGFGSGFRTW